MFWTTGFSLHFIVITLQIYALMPLGFFFFLESCMGNAMICRICVFTERRLPDCNIQAAVNCVLHVHVFQGLLQKHVDKITHFYYFINNKLVMLPGKKEKKNPVRFKSRRNYCLKFCWQTYW